MSRVGIEPTTRRLRDDQGGCPLRSAAWYLVIFLTFSFDLALTKAKNRAREDDAPPSDVELTIDLQCRHQAPPDGVS